MPQYLLGIDLGNTKAEYLLCTAEGDFVGIYNVRSPGRESYEALLNGIKQQMSVLLERKGVKTDEIAAVGIGLAIPYKAEDKKGILSLAEQILGIGGVDVSTDTGHGTYAYWLGKGVGVYSFASTGDIAMGLTAENKWVSVGGLRLAIGGEASGTYLHRKAVSLMYDRYYRCGEDSIAFPELLTLLDLDVNDLHRSLKAMVGKPLSAKAAEIIKTMDECALAGDGVAMSLFDDAGECAGRSVAGCVRKMKFTPGRTEDRPIPIVLVGSIWNKPVYDGMRNTFHRTVQTLTGKECVLRLPEAPPVVGGVLRAKEKADGKSITEDYRRKVLETTAINASEAELASLREGDQDDAAMLRHLVIIKKNRPQVAAKLEIDRQILDLMAKYPLLKGVGANLAAALLPAVSAVMKNDCAKALSRLISASRHVEIAQGDMASYYNLVAAAGTAAGGQGECQGDGSVDTKKVSTEPSP